MPEDRFIHPRLGHSQKVTSLTDFEFRVWCQYLLTADDYGVLPYSAAVIRGANLAIAARPDGAVMEALDVLLAIGLVLPFEHQGQRFLCDPVWQDFQKVRYPKRTYYPAPAAELFPKLSRDTARLFRENHTNAPVISPPLGHRRPPRSGRLTANGVVDVQGQEGCGEEGDPFEAFWSAYPKKRDRDDAVRAWAKLKPEPALVGTMMLALATQKVSADWSRENGRYVPYPATWLNRKRWLDEVAPSANGLRTDISGLVRFAQKGTSRDQQ